MDANVNNARWDDNYRYYKEIDKEYHRLALSLNLSDCEFYVLYTLSDGRENISQQDIVDEWTYSKQTVHSAILSLIKKDYVIMEEDSENRRRKILRLTKKGEAYIPLMDNLKDLEVTAFSNVPADVLALFNAKFADSLIDFKKGINLLIEGEKNETH